MNGQIIIDQLKFEINDHQHLISLSFDAEKTGLIGKNGVGKTTLLKLIVGQQNAISGKIVKNTEITYLPQDYQFDLNQSIADTLKITDKLDAIKNLNDNVINEELLITIGSDWDIEDRAMDILREFGLTNINLSKTLSELSGGERMKVALAGLFLFNNRFIILDEPTNNLDERARQVLYKHITSWKNGVLIVSHDRALLNLMDRIIELTDKGIKQYGGNFQSYEAYATEEKERGLRLLDTAKSNYKKTKKQAIKMKERQEKHSSHAKKSAITQNIPKIMLGAMQRSGQATTGKIKTLNDTKISSAAQSLAKAKSKIDPENEIYIDLKNTEVPKGKLIIEFKNISFDYNDTKNLIKNISFSIYGQERVAIKGMNGSGKTTLIKLMLKKLQPTTGLIRVGTSDIAYLDQQVTILNQHEKVVDNISRISGLGSGQSREWLAGFIFSKEQVFKTVEQLSGGEKVRVGLAAILAGAKPAKLIILDEPTNNLDIKSIQQIENVLLKYKGNLLIISHDQKFLENIGIERYIAMDHLT